MGLDFYNESIDLVKNNQDNDLEDKNLPNIDSISVSRNPNSDNELVSKNYLDDELDKNTILRYNQTIENDLKVSVGNIIYNFTNINNKIQLTDTTVMRTGNTRGSLMLFWKIVCNDKKTVV